MIARSSFLFGWHAPQRESSFPCLHPTPAMMEDGGAGKRALPMFRGALKLIRRAMKLFRGTCPPAACARQAVSRWVRSRSGPDKELPVGLCRVPGTPAGALPGTGNPATTTYHAGSRAAGHGEGDAADQKRGAVRLLRINGRAAVRKRLARRAGRMVAIVAAALAVLRPPLALPDVAAYLRHAGPGGSRQPRADRAGRTGGFPSDRAISEKRPPLWAAAGRL